MERLLRNHRFGLDHQGRITVLEQREDQARSTGGSIARRASFWESLQGRKDVDDETVNQVLWERKRRGDED